LKGSKEQPPGNESMGPIEREVGKITGWARGFVGLEEDRIFSVPNEVLFRS